MSSSQKESCVQDKVSKFAQEKTFGAEPAKAPIMSSGGTSLNSLLQAIHPLIRQ